MSIGKRSDIGTGRCIQAESQQAEPTCNDKQPAQQVPAPSSQIAAASVSTLDSLTVLKSLAGQANKQVIAREGADPEIRGYSAGKYFLVLETPVANIGDLSSLLQSVEKHNAALVIRGAPRPDLDLKQKHRRTKENFQTPRNGRKWILIDFDKIPLPSGLSLQQNVAAVCEFLITLLPHEFHAASYHWQLSSRAGLGDPSIASMHIWFWLNRPVSDAQLKAWGVWWNAKAGLKIVDTALFNDVQAHYTAAPQFVGMSDPFASRSGLVCKALDYVALVLPPTQELQKRASGANAPPVQTSGGFEAILGEIGDHSGGQGFHLPIIRAAASYVATHGREATDIEALYEVLSARVVAADRSHHDAGYVEHMASREHIIPAIEDAIAKYGHGRNARHKARQLPDVPPYFTGNAVSAAKASATLKKAIQGFFGP